MTTNKDLLWDKFVDVMDENKALIQILSEEDFDDLLEEIGSMFWEIRNNKINKWKN